MKPKNTFESVVRELVEGLETGTVRSVDPPAAVDGAASGTLPSGLRTPEQDRLAPTDTCRTDGDRNG